jgi:hypothetical protein
MEFERENSEILAELLSGRPTGVAQLLCMGHFSCTTVILGFSAHVYPGQLNTTSLKAIFNIGSFYQKAALSPSIPIGKDPQNRLRRDLISSE